MESGQKGWNEKLLKGCFLSSSLAISFLGCMLKRNKCLGPVNYSENNKYQVCFSLSEAGGTTLRTP